MASSAPDRSHESLVAVKPQEYSQFHFSAEHSLSPWAEIPNSDDSWASDVNELPPFEGWNNVDDDLEPQLTNTNHGDGKIDHLELSTPQEIEEIGYVDPGSVYGHGGLSHSAYPQDHRSGVTVDTSRVPVDAQTQSRPYQALKEMSTGAFETFGAESVPGNLTDLGRLKNSLGFSIPRVVVPDATVNTGGIRSESAVPALHTSLPSPTRHNDEMQNLDQSLRKALASGESTKKLSDISRYRPNNYQIAMFDRRPPHQPQFETPIADSVSAFYADADRTVLDHAAVSKTGESFGFNTRRLTGSIPTFQTSIRPPPGLQHCQSSLSNASSCSIPRSSLQASLCYTPPSSFQESTECQQVGSDLTRDRSLSKPARPPSVCITDSSSLTSHSLPNASHEAEKSCRCPHCPDRTFTDKSNLQRHRRDKHEGLAQLPCLKEGCATSFAPGRKDNRLKHVRAKHPDYRLPAPSRKRKRNADSDLESGSSHMQSFESGTTE